ncbi:PREDICTED: taste receptor type 2 member 5-like [Elephantulus edwardii]|uniref:taste receptor type 2 member 5-like n=1 Tax=Elephantulus edwardii TaxID=28737 RepID=UPI0003F0C4C5|nr:PREDICTED: taste receptor type 2 member 5-like [Elephantulus edwardii]
MLTTTQGLLLVMAMIEFFIGLLGNGALVVWSLGEWARPAGQSTYGYIVLGLAASRFLLQWLIMVDLILFPCFQNSRWLRYHSVAWVFVSQASLWFTAFLSIFYCLKISTCRHPACAWLKQRAYRVSLWGLLGYCIITLILVGHVTRKDHYTSAWGNSSVPQPFLNQHYTYLLKLNSGSFLPFSLFLLYSGMLMLSLYRHHLKMQAFWVGRRDPQARAHIKALSCLGCFLVLHIVYVLASPFSISAKSYPPDLTSVFFSETIMAASPSLHSVVLVLGNQRIKQSGKRVLQKLQRWWGVTWGQGCTGRSRCS